MPTPNDILFLAEFAAGAPARSALELATGAAELATQSGGSAVGLAYGPGAADGAAALGGHGAARVVVLGDEDRPAITYAAAAVAAVRESERSPSSRRPRRTAATSPPRWSAACTFPPSARFAPRGWPTASSRPSRPRSRAA